MRGSLCRSTHDLELAGTSPQQLEQGHPAAKFFAYDYLADAMEFHARAEPLVPDRNDDALLRHNTCVRLDRVASPVPGPVHSECSRVRH
jgi:hypothetical protein